MYKIIMDIDLLVSYIGVDDVEQLAKDLQRIVQEELRLEYIPYHIELKTVVLDET